MNASPAVDQLLAAMRESQEVWPYNAELIEDEYISIAVASAANGRERSPLNAALYPDTGPRFVSSGDLEAGYRSIQSLFDYPRTDVLAECERCAFHKRLSVGFEPSFKMLGVLAPPSIVLLFLCSDCQDELNRDYPAIHWGVELHGAL